MTNRPGLYLLVILCLLYSCSGNDKADRIADALDDAQVCTTTPHNPEQS